MIYIRYRDDPTDDAEVRQFSDEEYPEALEDLARFQENWQEVWMYLEGELVDDWVMLFDNTDPL